MVNNIQYTNKYIQKLIKVCIYNTFTNDQKTGVTLRVQKKFQKITSPRNV